LGHVRIYLLASLTLFKGNLINLFVGTFAVISLMVAQTIESVTGSSVNAMNKTNATSLAFSNESDSSMMNDRISIATTLALLVGIFQVNFNKR
jgi:MFS superfamily sulfate permease-like transporter